MILGEVFVSHVITLGIPAALTFGLTCIATHLRRPWFCFITALILTTCVYFIYLFGFNTSGVIVSITGKKNTSNSGVWTTIEGNVTPGDARIYLLVHPKDAQYWWLSSSVIQRGTEGAWKTEISLGDDKKGSGELYQVMALASTNPKPIDVVRNFWLSNIIRSTEKGVEVQRPPPLPHSEIKTIWREH